MKSAFGREPFRQALFTGRAMGQSDEYAGRRNMLASIFFFMFDHDSRSP